MKPIDQTPEGNCLAACIASIFGIELAAVPHFGTDDEWFNRFTKWMVDYFHLQPLELQLPTGDPIIGYYIINGPSANGDFWHSVVGKDGKIVHDPHPSRNALKNPETITVFLAVLGPLPPGLDCEEKNDVAFIEEENR